MAEVVVHPEARRRGIGSALMRAGAGRGRRRCADLGARQPRARPRRRPPRSASSPFANCCRCAGRWPTSPRRPPTACALRTYAGPADDAELLRVNNAAFSWHPEQGGWTEADIAERRARVLVRPRRVVPGFRRARPARCSGFHWTKVHGPDLGEVYVVGVDPPRRAGGWAPPDLRRSASSERPARAPTATVMLYVEADNSAAVKTYERLGFECLQHGRRVHRAVSPSAVESLSLFTVRSPFIRDLSTTAAYVAGEFEAVNRKWDK